MVMLNNNLIRQGRNEEHDRWRRKRAENAAAFNAYVQQQTAMGRKVTPQELDQYRMSLSGGNSYLMGGIPGQVVLEDVAQKQHIQAQQAQVSALAKQAEEQERVRNQIASVIPIDGTIEQARESVFKNFGESAPQVWGMFEQDIPRIQDQKEAERAETLFNTERMDEIREPKDVHILFHGEGPRVLNRLEKMAEIRIANSRQAKVGSLTSVVAGLNPETLSRMDETGRASVIQSIATSQGLPELSPEEMESLLGVANAIGGAMTSQLTERDSRAFNTSLWTELSNAQASGQPMSEEDILNTARRVGPSHGIDIESKEDLERYLGSDMRRWIEVRSYENAYNSLAVQEYQRAAALVQEETTRLDARAQTAYGHAVKNKSMRESGYAHTALLTLTEQGQYLSGGDTQTHIEFAVEAEKAGHTPDEIMAMLANEFGVRTTEDMIDSATQSALRRAGLGPVPGTSMADTLNQVGERADAAEATLLEALVAIPDGEEREARISATVRGLENVAESIRRDVRNRRGHAGFSEYATGGLINGVPWTVAAEETANQLEERARELRQRAAEVEYNSGLSGTSDAEELMGGARPPAAQPGAAAPVAPARSHGRSRNVSPQAFEESAAYDYLFRSRNEREAMRQQEMQPPAEEPQEVEPQSSFDSPYRTVASIPQYDAVPAAADVAHRFESLYGQVSDRPNSEFVGEFQMGKAKRAELGLTEQQAKDPVMARYAYERWAYQRAIPSLQEVGIPVSPVSIYLTWQQGVRGFRDIYQTAQSDLPPSAARQRNMDNNRPPALPGEPRLPKGATAREWLAAWERAISSHQATDRHQEALRRGTTRQA